MHYKSPNAPLLLAVFLVTAGMGMVWSVLAAYATHVGASMTMVGVLIGAFGAARLISSMPAGLLAEAFGRRRVIIAGLLIFTIGSFATVCVDGIGLLLICLLMQGSGTSIYMTASLTALAESGNACTRVRDMSVFQGASMFGLSIGPAIGGMAAGTWGYSAPFALQGGLGLLAALAVLAGPRGAQEDGASIDRCKKPGMRFSSRTVGLMIMTYSTFFIRAGANWVVLPMIAARNLAMSLVEIGGMLTLGAISTLIALPATTFLARRIDRKHVVMCASLCTLVSLGLLLLSGASVFIWASAIMLGFGSGLAIPTLTAYMADDALPERMGAAMGVLRTVSDVGVLTGPIVVGLAVDGFGPDFTAALAVCASLALATVFVFLRTTRSLN